MSPVGELIIGSVRDSLCLCYWPNERRKSKIDSRICRILNAKFKEGSSSTIERAAVELEEYFNGTRKGFDIHIAFAGTTFQHIVWMELMRIPYGTTISYAELAQRIGMPKAVRAVANAIAMNPISIFVPCHRVIGANNTLTGYGGGLQAKEFLINLEKGIGTIDFSL